MGKEGKVMKLIYTTLLLLLVMPELSHAYKLDMWDKLLLGTFITGQLLDGLQTIEILNNPNFYEKNDLYNNSKR